MIDPTNLNHAEIANHQFYRHAAAMRAQIGAWNNPAAASAGPLSAPGAPSLADLQEKPRSQPASGIDCGSLNGRIICSPTRSSVMTNDTLSYAGNSH
jgi:hypothetical protein